MEGVGDAPAAGTSVGKAKVRSLCCTVEYCMRYRELPDQSASPLVDLSSGGGRGGRSALWLKEVVAVAKCHIEQGVAVVAGGTPPSEVGEEPQLPGQTTRQNIPKGQVAKAVYISRSKTPRISILHNKPHQLSPFKPQRQQSPPSRLMESPLNAVWDSAVGSPFFPAVGKDSQFFVGITLLTLGLLLTGFFGLSKFMLLVDSAIMQSPIAMCSARSTNPARLTLPDRSVVNIPLVGIPASLSVAYVTFSFTRYRQAYPNLLLQIRCHLHDLRGRCLCLIKIPLLRKPVYNSWSKTSS